jgi:YaiO family outer membrane protein
VSGWTHLPAWSCLVGTLLLSCPHATAADQSPAERARAALARRDLQTASDEINRQLDQKPDDVEWLLLRADLVGARGRAAEALAQIRAIRERNPDNRLARMKEAQWLSRLGWLNSAQTLYEALLMEAPTPEIRALLGLLHQWRGDWHEAGKLFSDALNEAREDPLPLLAQLRGWTAMGLPGRAWTRARQRDAATGATDAELGLVLAEIAAGVGALDQVESYTSRPTERSDLALRQNGLRAIQYARAGQLDRAMGLLHAIADIPAPDYDAFIQAADGYAAVDESHLARRYYLQARELTPERPEAWLGLARLASREGRLHGSVALYQQLTAANPEAFEGWLGQIRMAQLLDEPALAEDALQAAWRLAPRSALLHREHLRLSLRRGDLAAFRDGVHAYLRDQPEDQTARLFEARLRLLDGEELAVDEILKGLDPLAPGLGSQFIRIGLRVAATADAVLHNIPSPAEPELERAARETLAEQLALVLEPDAAIAVVSPDDRALHQWISSLSQGWWAYLSAPLAMESELTADFDPQSRAVWLANQIQNRLRVLNIETESPLEEEWLLIRAAWFQRWHGRQGSLPAALDLATQLRRLIPGGTGGVRRFQIEEAWRRGDQPLAPEVTTLQRRIAQARWRQYRFDIAGALRAYRELERVYPDAAEPRHAQVQLLRASGRWSDAAELLRRLALGDNPPPLIRLQFAELLRRLGRFSEARQQLDRLAADGFDEPELYLHRAQLAQAEGSHAAAESWINEGLIRFPRATLLNRFLAGQWLERSQIRELAQLLEQGANTSWCTPDMAAAAWPLLNDAVRQSIAASAAWWFNWQWLPWIRLEARSVAELQRRAREAAAAGQLDMALRQLQPGIEARIPDSDLWLAAARLYDFNGEPSASARAWSVAERLGMGRPDARISQRTLESRRRPIEVARELASQLEDDPGDPALRKGLVTALLRAGEVNAATRALEPLVISAPDDVEVRMLAAEVKGAQGRIRQGRSLYSSILRNDPLAADAHAGLLALADVSEWGVHAGYEYDVLRDTSPANAGISDWQEAFIATSWRRPFHQTWVVEYRWHDRYDSQAHQLALDWTRALDRDWILRLNAAGAQDEDIIAKWRFGGGISHRVADILWVGLDGRYLDYSGVNVWQLVPAITWRWHPKGTLEGRLYLSDNQFQTGASETSLTWMLQASWETGRHSMLTLFYAQGDEDSLDPIPGLIANDTFLSVGARYRFSLNRHWHLEPAYRFEQHEHFDLHGLGLTVSRRF